MSSTNLYEASNQWANRPDDERFESVDSLLAHCEAEKELSRTAHVPFATLKAVADGSQVCLTGKEGAVAKLTNYAFGQISNLASAPAGFLRQLPAGLAADVLNDRLAVVGKADPSREAKLFVRSNGSLIAKAVTSERYDRIFNADVIRRGIVPLTVDGWRVPPARPSPQSIRGTRKATEADILPNQGDFGLAVKVGDDIAPAGLYASDRDFFAFLVDPNRRLDIGGRALMRGIFVRNSEVGDGALIIDWFDLDNVCGNHIVWGAENRKQIRVRHLSSKSRADQGDVLRRALAKYSIEAKAFDDSAGEREALLANARKVEIAATKEEVIEAVFKFAKSNGLPQLGKKTLEAAYDAAESRTDWYGSPRTVWGVVSGITQHSQTIPYANERHSLDVAAGKVLEMAF